MSLTEKKWFLDLQLSEADFESCPKDSNPLSWAIDNNIVSENLYTQWASKHYELPEVQSEFFSMAVDKQLCEKYQDIYSWSEDFFPIYEWENLLYVSCLEPIPWENSKDICQIIAPHSAMKSLWSKIHPPTAVALSTEQTPQEKEPASNQESIQIAQEEAEVPNLEPIAQEQMDTPSLDPMKVAQEETEIPSFNLDQIPDIKEVSEAPTKAPDSPTLDVGMATSLDFSSLAGTPPENPPIVEEEIKKAHETPPNPEEALQGLSFGELAPPPPIDDDLTPAPDIVTVTTAPPIPAPVTKPEPPIDFVILETPAQPVIPAPPKDLAGEIPPPPLKEKEPLKAVNPQVATQAVPPAPPKSKPAASAPPASPSPPLASEHLVQESDLLGANELSTCTSINQVVLHIFSHIHQDFEKLMWISKEQSEAKSKSKMKAKLKGKTFTPEFVYGEWAADKKTWATPVNVDKPNIFRITWNSRLPFHGNISNNATNQSYFDLWNQGTVPEHITIFPLLTGVSECQGFIVGMGQGKGFDNHQTYRKLQNLLSLSHKQLTEQAAS